MKVKILAYEKNPDGLRFLKTFFRNRKDYDVIFAQDAVSLRRKAIKNKHDKALCIVSADRLKEVSPLELGCPVIAVISDSSTAGIKSAAKSGIDDYILSPFYKEDLLNKINAVISRRSLVEGLKKETTDMRTLTELTSLVSSTLDPQEILYLIVKKISEVINVTRCSIVRIDDNRRYANVVATFEDPDIRNIRLDLNKYPEIRRSLLSKDNVIVKDIRTDPLMERVRDIIFPLGIRSIMVIPIIFRNEVIGTLFLRTSRSSSSFRANEVALCKAIANASANALHNAFLFEKVEDERLRLEKLAITDYLTGIFNVRYFYHRLTEEFSRAERYSLNLSCLMFDIDHFKDINDKFGHKTGDIVLREFSQLLKRHTRKSDVLARYGGEEFIMLLLQTSSKSASAKANALRATIEKYKFRVLKGQGRMTMSIGVSSYPHPGIRGMEDLISLADNALYKAKLAGRNKVVVA